MAIYLKIQNINGNVTSKGHENWIEIDSFNFGVNRKVQNTAGRATERYIANPAITEIELTKKLDRASTQLLAAALKGKPIEKIYLDFCHAGDSLSPFLQYTLHDVMISNRHLSGYSGGTLTETLTLNFTAVDERFTGRRSDNTPESPFSTGYNLTTREVG